MAFYQVLGGDDHEGLVKNIGVVVGGNLFFVHCLQQGALGAWCGAIDFIGQNNVGEQGAFFEMETFFLLIVNGNTGYVCGQKIVGELDAFEIEL